MMYIPDPLEIMEARIDQLCDQWDAAQKDVPAGSFRCPYCGEVYSYEPIQFGASPDSACGCYNCLPDDLKAVYDRFEDECR